MIATQKVLIREITVSTTPRTSIQRRKRQFSILALWNIYHHLCLFYQSFYALTTSLLNAQ